jgi:hypothetical protein
MKRRDGQQKHALILLIVLAVVFFQYGSLKAQQQGSSGASAPAVQPGTASGVIATADGETPGVRVEVLELKRVSGGTLNLRFVMINESDKKVGFGYSFADRDHEGIDFNSVGGVHLVDAAGKKKYLVIRDSEKKCVCSQKLDEVKPQSRINLWAKLPAPPDNVEKISIVIPHFMPMDDVPISR